MNKRITMVASVMAAFMVAATHAKAHCLWIAPGSAGHRLHFGEAEILLKGKSPGRLDGFQAPRARAPASAVAPELIPVTRAADHFAPGTTSNARAVVALDESMAVRDLGRSGPGLAKTNDYARFPSSGVVEKQGFLLPPDALASGRQGIRTMTVLYRGEPLGGAKVRVIAPNTWMQ